MNMQLIDQEYHERIRKACPGKAVCNICNEQAEHVKVFANGGGGSYRCTKHKDDKDPLLDWEAIEKEKQRKLDNYKPGDDLGI